MKFFFFNMALWFSVTPYLFSQSYDVQWIQGPVPMAIMDFRGDLINFRHLSDTISAFISTASISNKEGEFLFFSNGIYVRDRNGSLMPNGDSLSFYNPPLYEVIYPNGAPQDQGVLILPKPESESLYYIFHYSTVDTSYLYLSQVNNDPIFFYYSVVDMSGNNGLGTVIQKNIRLPADSLSCSSRLTAVKHGNGRDWWVIRHGQRDNKYIQFLVTPDSILGPFNQYIGPPFNQNRESRDFYGGSVFAQMGDKMATGNSLGPLVILDFDRCTGEFYNPFIINNRLADDSTLMGVHGLAFSPNGRFLYVNNIYELNQYDLWSATPNDSVRLYTVDSTDAYWLHTMLLGPNGKVYIGTWNGGLQALHVINHPNVLGTACNFQFAGQSCMSANTNNLPNMVNYRLGKLAGSPCDTLASAIEAPVNTNEISIAPNPAIDIVDITIKGEHENAAMEVFNSLGQLMISNTVSKHIQLKVSGWDKGVYLVRFTDSKGKQDHARLIVL